MASKETIQERITMLLRKAESTDSVHEAEALSAAAAKLMIKHSIDESTLNRDGDDKVVVVKVRLDGRWQTAWVHGFSVVVYALRLDCYYNTYDGARHLQIVGLKSDAEAAANLIRSLQMQSLAALKSWSKSFRNSSWYADMTTHERFLERRSFMEHFGHGAAARITESMLQVIDENPGSELVLAERSGKIEDFMKTRKITAGRNAAQGYFGAVGGREAGKNATGYEKNIEVGQRAIER